MTDHEQSNRDENQNNNKESQQSSDYSRFNPMRPVQWYSWYSELKNIEKFNLWILLFTAVLSFVGVFQVAAYVETERAYMVVEDVRLFTGEPISDDGGLDMGLFIQNVGKHLAIITDFSATIDILTSQKDLPEHPEYLASTSRKLVAAPQVTQQKTMIPLRVNKATPPRCLWKTLSEESKTGRFRCTYTEWLSTSLAILC